MSDLIDRQAAYEVLTSFYHHNTDAQHMALQEALNKVPSAQPDVPDTNVGNMISRQAAIDAVRSYYDECDEREESIEERIERLPSADIDLSDFSDKLWRAAYERGKAEVVRHGKWLHGQGFAGNYFDCLVCNQCKKESMANTNYCPHCGALMDEVAQ